MQVPEVPLNNLHSFVLAKRRCAGLSSDSDFASWEVTRSAISSLGRHHNIPNAYQQGRRFARRGCMRIEIPKCGAMVMKSF